jgi:hypothetical protein
MMVEIYLLICISKLRIVIHNLLIVARIIANLDREQAQN